MSQSPSATFRIGTRGSALALWQANAVKDALAARFPDRATELVVIKPEGDVDKHSSLQQIGGRGVFTSALQLQILNGQIDCAVHSSKDLPSLAPHGITIAAFPQREDARDALITRHGVGLDELPANPVIGTSSRRRAAQILQIRPDAEIRDLRGNIDTRLRKGLSEEFDAVILAAAGLKRMGWESSITSLLPIEVSCPAPAQGALAIETLSAPGEAHAIIQALDDADVRAAVAVERAFLRGVGGGCTTPIGAHAVIERMHGIATMRFWGMLGSEDGSRVERIYSEWPTDSAFERAFEAADTLMRSVSPKWTGVDQREPLRDRKILVTGSASHVNLLAANLLAQHANVSALQTVRITTQPVELPADADWLVIASRHAVPAIDWKNVPANIAVVGAGTASAVRSAGAEPTLVSAGPGAGQLAAELIAQGIDGKHIVCVLSDIARSELTDALVQTSARVTVLTGYCNEPIAAIDGSLLARIASAEFEAVTFASPSSVHAFLALVGPHLPALSGAALIAIGPTTAAAMDAANLPVHTQASASTVEGLASALATYFGGNRPGAQS